MVVEAQVFGRRAAEQYEAAVKYTGADLPSASIDGVAVSFTVGEFETAVGQFLERLCYATGAHGKPLMVGTGPVGRARTYRTTEKGSIVCPWGDETTSARRRADKANHGINLAPVVSGSQPNPVLLGLGTLSYSPPPVHA